MEERWSRQERVFLFGGGFALAVAFLRLGTATRNLFTFLDSSTSTIWYSMVLGELLPSYMSYLSSHLPSHRYLFEASKPMASSK